LTKVSEKVKLRLEEIKEETNIWPRRKREKVVVNKEEENGREEMRNSGVSS
jgi:hypothetical protein